MTRLLTPDEAAARLSVKRSTASASTHSQRMLGHASASMTGRYVTTTDAMLRAAADAMTEALG